MTTADHLQNLAAEVATLDRKLKQNAKALGETTDALIAILGILQDHPLFRPDLFEARDLDVLETIGGDEATINHLAILAANVIGDGLKAPDDKTMAAVEAEIADI